MDIEKKPGNIGSEKSPNDRLAVRIAAIGAVATVVGAAAAVFGVFNDSGPDGGQARSEDRSNNIIVQSSGATKINGAIADTVEKKPSIDSSGSSPIPQNRDVSPRTDLPATAVPQGNIAPLTAVPPVSEPDNDAEPGAKKESQWYEPADAVEETRPRTSYYTTFLNFSPPSSCQRRISGHYGIAGGIISNSLLRPGNPSCVQASYGDMMAVTVELCGGALTEIQQIEVERGAFLEDGRKRTYPASLSYSLIANGQETPPMPLGTGGYASVQRASFAPISASAVRIILRSPRTTGYKIFQRLCSISVR